MFKKRNNTKVTELFLQDFKCFKGENNFVIKPLTLLVGENNTGKSTILSGLQVFENRYLDPFSAKLHFDPEACKSDRFLEMIRRANPPLTDFSIGAKLQYGYKKNLKIKIVLSDIENITNDFIKQIHLEFEKSAVRIFSHKSQLDDFVGVKGVQERKFSEFPLCNSNVQYATHENSFFVFPSEEKHPFSFPNLLNELEKCNIPKLKELNEFVKTSTEFRVSLAGLGLANFMPPRSRPEHSFSYDSDFHRSIDSSENEEIACFLIHLYQKRPDEWKHLKAELVSFGQKSGLFSDIGISEKSAKKPSQLKFKIQGFWLSLNKVGCGVSKILPILVHIFLQQLNQYNLKTWFSHYYLLQHPETGLHPKVHAEFMSLLAELAKEPPSASPYFIIETHSQYLIDRMRIEIMEKSIDPDDVGMIFLEPVNDHVKVHNVGFDSMANFQDLPGTYGKFFIRETNRRFGLGQ